MGGGSDSRLQDPSNAMMAQVPSSMEAQAYLHNDKNRAVGGLQDTDMRMMVRGSLLSSEGTDEGLYPTQLQNQITNKSSEDLTLDMLGGPTTASAMTLRPQQSQQHVGAPEDPQQVYGQKFAQMTTKNPPSSALNLLSNADSKTTLMQQQNNFPQVLGGINKESSGKLSSDAPLSLEQYRQNNSNLQNLLMQFDSTPQFNQQLGGLQSRTASQAIAPGVKHADSAPHTLQAPALGNLFGNSKQALGQQMNPSASSVDTVHEVSQFTYPTQPYGQANLPRQQSERNTGIDQTNFQMQVQQMHQNKQQRAPEEFDQIRENLKKIDMLQQAINVQPQGAQNQAPAPLQRAQPQFGSSTNLQQAGYQIMQGQNENKNQTNFNDQNLDNLKMEAAKSVPLPDASTIMNNHKNIMAHFDDIPINKIKTMVGYQTNQEMYKEDAKLNVQDSEPTAKTAYDAVKETGPREQRDSDDSDGDDQLSIEERLQARKWKTRLRACKEINSMFYNDYAKLQTQLPHDEPIAYASLSFEQFGPCLQEMIKDTNLTNAFEALQCLHSFVKFAPDIKNVTFACHNHLLEKVNLTNRNFKDITSKIILCMMGRLSGPQNTMLAELLKRFKSANAKTATFCMQVMLEAVKHQEYSIAQDVNLKQLFRAVQPGLTHQNKQLRDSAYAILKFICERCKDEPQIIVDKCTNLRPVQIKELGEDLAKVQKIPNAVISLFDDLEQDIQDPKSKTHQQPRGGVLVTCENVDENEAATTEIPIEQEVFDLMTLIPDDFNEIPYTNAINTKKKSMEQFNTELQKIVDKGQAAIVKTKDYSSLLNIIFHMLEDKNMLVFTEAMKTVELLSTLQQFKSAPKVKQFITVLACKYGETKTAVITQTDKVFAALSKHSLPVNSFCDTLITIATTHKNPRVKQFLIQNPLSQFMQHSDAPVVQQMFKLTQKQLIQLILKDNNDAVRNASVQLIVEFAQKIKDDTFQQTIKEVIQQLPKFRIQEITKKLSPEPPAEPLTKTMPAQKPVKAPAGEIKEDPEAPMQITSQQFYQNLLRMMKLLPQNTQSASKLESDFREALDNPETVQILQKQRHVLLKAFADVLIKGKSLQAQKEQIVQIVALFRELHMADINQNVTATTDQLRDFVTVGLLMTEVQVEHESGLTSQCLTLGLDSVNQDEQLLYLEMLRDVLEQSAIIGATNAIQIILNVYLWLGLKLQDFIHAGIQFTDIEELRSIGIKYLESTHLFTEQQRQSLIQTMIRFKDQISEARCEVLQTLGQPMPSARSHNSSQQDQKQLTAQFNRENMNTEMSLQDSQPPIPPAKPQITASLICETIDREFEQGLLMFKELAQSSDGKLDFECKEKIFQKLLMIVSTDQFASSQQAQQQQYKQAYALKALMWMKEETMGLEDTFKLTTAILSTYLAQIRAEIDTSVELYLLNFWVRELSIRDLCDRIQQAVASVKPMTGHSRQSSARSNQNKTSIEQLDAFATLFQWMCEHKLDPHPSDWRLSDLRKVALLICESVLTPKSTAKAVCNSFLTQIVERDTKEKVLEFMEIQLMHSNDLFLQFLDWFQQKFPTHQEPPTSHRSQVPKVDVSKIIPTNQQEPSQYIEESATESTKQFLQQVQQDNLLRQQQDTLQQSQQLTERSVQENQRAYLERRREKKQSSMLQNAEHQELQTNKLNKIVEKEPAQPQQRKSRYDEPFTAHDQEQIQLQKSPEYEYNQNRSNPAHLEDDDDLPLEQIKQQSQRLVSAGTRKKETDELQERFQQSEAKQRDWVQKIIQLEAEKQRIEDETENLRAQNNQESAQYQQKLMQMHHEHQQVTGQLSDVNQCYQQQVDENEKLKIQLSQMQQQHEDMIARFDQLERKINSREQEQRERQVTPPRSSRAGTANRDPLMNSVAKLQRISDTFQVTDQKIGVSKICELLLSVERNVDGELAQPLISHYCKMRTIEERFSMIQAVGDALSVNEDVLLALSLDVYKALLNFLLRAFAHERERIDTQSLQSQKQQEQNQITTESQKLVSRLLNTKNFTSSLVVLFQLLREAMPADISVQLRIEEGQYLRVVMRCISRITKALHSEASDLIRGFDVLLEMQKVFIICPPENLREDLPSLQDFDFVFRGMKDVSDKFIELQPEKVMSFLGYFDTKGQPDNAFIKYLRLKTTGAR